jgi:UDP-N-acetylglucosamine transferase subunit ALG13
MLHQCKASNIVIQHAGIGQIIVRFATENPEGALFP